MEQKKLSVTLDRFKSVFHEGTLNRIGKTQGFCKRLRVVTPHRLVVSLLTVFSCTRVETLADIHRGLTALFGKDVAYKPFHNQLSKQAFPVMMRDVASELLTKLAVRVLGVKRGGLLSEFKGIIIQDGSSFAIKDSLKKVFPGRFTTVSPAAVEIHVTMDLLEGSVQDATLTADTEGEREHLPDAATLKDRLILADRGYFELKYFAEVQQAGGRFIVRSKNSINPLILRARTTQGKRLKRMEGKNIKEVKLLKRTPLDLEVEWERKEGPVRCRLIVSWNPKTKEFGFFATNLPRERYAVADVSRIYRLRWQIELLFKEWKSYANLHAFDTSKETIVEGLIWAALCAAAIKRYLGFATQIIAKVHISTRKVSMCAVHVLFELLSAIAQKSPFRTRRAWRRAIEYLAANATRAHPKRDRSIGSLATGLQPVFAIP